MLTGEPTETKTLPAEQKKQSASPQPPRRSGWFFHPYFQILFSILLSGAAQIFLKKGATESVSKTAAIPFGISGLASPWIWAGIACLVGGLFSWLYSLRFIPLVIAFNLAGLQQVLVPLVCWGYLGEEINWLRGLGIGMVFVGVLIVAKPLIKIEEL